MLITKSKKSKIAAALLTASLVVGCASNETASSSTPIDATNATVDVAAGAVNIVLTDADFLAKVANTHTTYEVQNDALVVVFDQVTKSQASAKWPNMKFRPVSGNYDWSSKKGLVLNIENKGNEEARVEMKVADNIGIMGAATHQLDLPIYLPAGATTRVEFLFDGAQKQLEGYRGGSDLALNLISEFQLYAVGPIAQQTLVINAIDYID